MNDTATHEVLSKTLDITGDNEPIPRLTYTIFVFDCPPEIDWTDDAVLEKQTPVIAFTTSDEDVFKKERAWMMAWQPVGRILQTQVKLYALAHKKNPAVRISTQRIRESAYYRGMSLADCFET